MRKPDGRWRLTIDYRKVNVATVLMAPIVANLPAGLAGISAATKWFSVLDIDNCYFAIPLTPESQSRFGFTFQNIQLTFQRVLG